MGEERKVYRVLVGNTEGKRPFATPRRRWEHGIGMDLREIDWGAESILLAQYRYWWRALVNTVKNLQVLGAMELVTWVLH
jgi:hypothetical protein